MKKAIALVGGLGLFCGGTAFANDGPEVVRDGAVLGYWQFNDATFKKDSGVWGNDITDDFQSGVTGVASGTAAHGYDGSGYLNIQGSSKSVSVSIAKAPSFNNTTRPYFTLVERFKSSKSYGGSGSAAEILSDTTTWHFLAARYQVGGSSKPTYSSYSYMYCCDPDLLWQGTDFWNASGRPEEGANSMAKLPISVSGTTVKIGGYVGSTSYPYEGTLDDVIVVNRMMAKSELTRCFLTGETYVYATGTPSFGAASGWSSNEGTINFKPGDIPGQAYIIDGGKTMTQSATATFGGDGFTGSLTLGRTEPLMNRVASPNTELVAASAGNFTHNTAETTVGFYDLRLRKGVIAAAADGQTLAATKLEVAAPAATPFAISVASGAYSLNVGAGTTGSGVLAKTGAGKLTVNVWTGTAKLRLAEGSVKTPRFNGYAGGTVLVSTDSTVAFVGDDVLPTTANRMKILFDGTKPTAKTAVMTVPSAVTAAMIQDTTSYDNGQVGMVTVENGTVYVEPGYPEDQGAVPVLMAE